MGKVLLLGRLRDVAGWRERVIDPLPATLSSLRTHLSEQDAQLGEALAGPGVQAAVNKIIARGDVALAANDEIAFLPPMSGG